MFLIIGLFNMIFHYDLFTKNPFWGFIICLVFVVGMLGTIGSLMILPNSKKTNTIALKHNPIKGAILSLKKIFEQEEYVDKIGKPYYGLTENGIFGARIVAGIVTGVRLTEDKPLYEISYEKNSWWVKEVTNDRNKLLDMLKVQELNTIAKGAKIKLKHHD